MYIDNVYKVYNNIYKHKKDIELNSSSVINDEDQVRDWCGGLDVSHERHKSTIKMFTAISNTKYIESQTGLKRLQNWLGWGLALWQYLLKM